MIKLNLFTKQKQTHRLKKTNLQLLVGDVWEEGMVRESGMDMHTLLYLKWITNKHLLYSTGDCSVLCLEERMGTCMFMAESLLLSTYKLSQHC